MKTILRAIPAAALLLGLWGCGGTDKCLGHSTKCDGTCVSLQDDVMNCGVCGNACADGQTCSAGTCAATCATGYDLCGGTACADLQTDATHCGTCDTVCDGSQVCRSGSCVGFTLLASGMGAYGLPDFVPAGADTIYVASSWEVDAYSISGDTFTNLGVSGTFGSSYSYPAWVGDNLYVIEGGNLDTYSISGSSFASAAVTDMPTASDAQTTADDSGNLYAMATDGTIIQYNPTTEVLATFTGPTDLNNGEPRAAWDSKTAKLYVGNYYMTPFYSLDPATGTLTTLAPFPMDLGINDAFCSDRQGHIYTSDSNGMQTFMYDTASDTWTTVGFPPFQYYLDWEGSCTVTADGYLYFGNGDDGYLFSMKL